MAMDWTRRGGAPSQPESKLVSCFLSAVANDLMIRYSLVR